MTVHGVVSSPETAQRVLAYLTHRATDGRATASLTEIGADLRIGSNTAHRAVRRLIREGEIRVVRRGTGGPYRTTYAIKGPGWPWP